MSELPKISVDTFNKISKEFAKIDYINEFTQLFTEQNLAAESLAIGFMLNQAMAKGFLICYQMLKEQLKANEVKELEELGKL